MQSTLFFFLLSDAVQSLTRSLALNALPFTELKNEKQSENFCLSRKEFEGGWEVHCSTLHVERAMNREILRDKLYRFSCFAEMSDDDCGAALWTTANQITAIIFIVARTRNWADFFARYFYFLFRSAVAAAAAMPFSLAQPSRVFLMWLCSLYYGKSRRT